MPMRRTTSTRTLTVPAGGTASFVAALAPLGAAAGWVTINSPVELQVLEGGALLGTTSMSRLMMPAGKRQLELSSAALGFQTSITVDVQPGKSVTSNVQLPIGCGDKRGIGSPGTSSIGTTKADTPREP